MGCGQPVESRGRSTGWTELLSNGGGLRDIGGLPAILVRVAMTLLVPASLRAWDALCRHRALGRSTEHCSQAGEDFQPRNTRTKSPRRHTIGHRAGGPSAAAVCSRDLASMGIRSVYRDRGGIMAKETRWRVDVLVDDVTAGERTRAWTRLRTPDGLTFVGVGEAHRDPTGTGDTAAVSHALSDLTHRLSPAVPTHDRRSTLRHGLAELSGYLGGGLMFGGAALLVAMSWADLTRSGRIALLTAVTVGFLGFGLMISGKPLPRRSLTGGRSRLAAVLLGLGAGTSALSAGSVAGTDKVFWAAVAGFVVAALGYLAVRSVIGVVTWALFSGMAAPASWAKC